MRHVSYIDLVEKKSGVVSKHLTFGLRNGESERRKAESGKLKQQPEFTLCWLSWE